MGKWVLFIGVAVLVGLQCGCDPLTVHKVTSTIFDGVPSMPPADQYCKDYHVKATEEERAAETKLNQPAETGTGSSHPPYAEKRCDGCHDKNTESGFVVPRKDLCLHCHKGFMRWNNQHGPAAVGDCLACHLPHDSKNRKLLKQPRAEVCGVCHTERRQAFGLHSTVRARKIACADCHNPHGGNDRFFLE
jgi:predicted CXXCH cytochrome family protein